MPSIHQKRGLKLPRLQHVALPVPIGAQQAIRAFYGGVLELVEKPVPSSMLDGGLIWFAVGDGEMELHFIPDPEHLAHPEGARHICLEVEDLASYREAITGAGHEIFEASPIPQRPRFFCLDPFGNKLEFTTILGDYQETT